MNVPVNRVVTEGPVLMESMDINASVPQDGEDRCVMKVRFKMSPVVFYMKLCYL